jgi:hypothetical protein
MIQQRRHRDLEYVNSLFKDTEHITGTILRVDVDIGLYNYTSTIGDPMKEETLILGDPENNIIMCFQQQDGMCNKGIILEGVNIVPYFKYGVECRVHKRQEPGKLSNNLINIITNVHITNVSNSFSEINLEKPGQSNDGTDRFMSCYYRKGGMVLLADVKRHPEWNNEYLQNVETRFVNICKSCGSKAIKKCCPEYSSNNRKKLKMVIGWHSE